MRHLLILMLCGATIGVTAEDLVVAQYADGTAIRNGDTVAADGQTALTLPGMTRSEVILAAGSRATFHADAQQLRIDLEAGTIQVDVDGLGPWQGLSVRGVASEVTVIGTLFIVARDRRGVDTVALVRGAVQLRLRQEIVAALGQNPTVDLSERQQITAGPNGFTNVVTLSLPLLLMAKATTEDPDTDAVVDAIMDGLLDDVINAGKEAGGEITETTSGTIGLPPPPPIN